jgi:hypothetical protein
MSGCLPQQYALAGQTFNSTQLAQVVPAIQQYANGVSCNVTVVLFTFTNAALQIGQAAIVFLIIAGTLLYFSRLNKRLGKELLEGGILIAIFIAYGVPYLMSVHP